MVKEKAYAKINLFLNVVSKRFDGYHDLEMVMASLELHDKLTFKKTDDHDITVRSNVKITQSPKTNIVYKIAAFLKEEFDIKEGVEIYIEKHIPIAAGLGGGSADAAATLRGLNKLWKLNLSLEDMAKIGANYGADIPFCVYNKLCVAKGKGEELMFLNTKLKLPILLVNPNIKVSTKDVFEKVKQEEIVERKISDMTSAIYNKNFELIVRELHNSLESITFEMEPKVKEIKHQMIDWGLDGALMCGSGSTVFGLAKSKKKLALFKEIMPENYMTSITKIR